MNKVVLNDCKRQYAHFGISWIRCKKYYDMVLHSWILEGLELFQVSKNNVKYIKRFFKNWNTELPAGILLLVVCMFVTLKQISRNANFVHVLKNLKKLNHLLFMYDLKLFGKMEGR